MDELLGAEEAVVNACENLKAYLAAAATFDGREIIMDFSGDEPMVAAPTLAALAPPPPPAPTIAARVQDTPLLSPPPAPAAAGASMSAMMADRTYDEPPLTDKFKEWWGGLTGGQKAGTIGVALVALYILSKIF
jgi:hypothetical protein